METSSCSERIVFLSGVHSCGKSTLLDRLARDADVRYIVWKREQREELFLSLYPDLAAKRVPSSAVRARLLLRLKVSSEELGHQLSLIQTLAPTTRLITDRCPLDVLSYIGACRACEWINHSDHEQLVTLFHRTFSSHCGSWMGLLIRPPLEWVLAEFTRRCVATSSQYGVEESFLRLAYAAFTTVYAHNRYQRRQWPRVNDTDTSLRVLKVLAVLERSLLHGDC